jgi:hypothetical protein
LKNHSKKLRKKKELEKEMENIREKHEWGETSDGSWSIALIMTDTSNNILPENLLFCTWETHLKT